MIYEYLSIKLLYGILEQFFKIKKNKNTGHPCTFVLSYMNTICLNDLFDYNKQLEVAAFRTEPKFPNKQNVTELNNESEDLKPIIWIHI